MKVRVDLKILFFFAFFYFTKQLNLYILTLFFALIHECSHIIVAKLLGLKIQSIEFMPFGFFTNMQASIDDYNIKFGKSNLVEFKKIFIVIAGPLLNLFLAFVLSSLDKTIVYVNLVLFFFNIIPIFPLDGGRLLKSILKIILGPEKAQNITKIFTKISCIILIAVGSALAIHIKNMAVILILIFQFLLWKAQ